MNTPIEVCEQRDPKGLYKQARAGEITGFTGIDDPYEAPLAPELVIGTGRASAADSATEIAVLLQGAGSDLRHTRVITFGFTLRGGHTGLCHAP